MTANLNEVVKAIIVSDDILISDQEIVDTVKMLVDYISDPKHLTILSKWLLNMKYHHKENYNE